MTAKQKFRAATAIRHDGQEFAEGDTVEMTEREAAQMLESGALVKHGARAAPAGTDPNAPNTAGGTDPDPVFSGAAVGPDGAHAQGARRK